MIQSLLHRDVSPHTVHPLDTDSGIQLRMRMCFFQPSGRPTAADLLLRRVAGEWQQQVKFPSSWNTYGQESALNVLKEREKSLDARENAIKPKNEFWLPIRRQRKHS